MNIGFLSVPVQFSCGWFSRLCPACLAVALLIPAVTSFAGFGASLSVTPTDIVWDTNTWVNMDITGLATGQAVDLALYADINKNGDVDAMDTPVMRFKLQDGVTNGLGSQVIVCDTNGVADGQIHARVSYHGVTSLAQIWHAIGQYVWQVSEPNGSALTTAVFTVSQPTSTVWITGSAQVITNLEPVVAGIPLPGTLAVMNYYSSVQGHAPSVWADSNGDFVLYLPDGVSTDNVCSVSAIAFDHFMAETGPGPSNAPLSTVYLTGVLHEGSNSLSQPLFVVPPVPGMLFTLSGHVYDENTNALAGVLVYLGSESEEGGDSFGMAMTDTNGAFAAPMPNMGGDSISVYAMNPTLNMRGLVGGGMGIGVLTADVSGIDLYLPSATTLVKGSVRKMEGPDGIMGADVSFHGDAIGNEAFSFDSEGNFEIGMVGGSNITAEIGDDSIKPLRRFCPKEVATNIELPSSGDWTNLTVQTKEAWVVSGKIYDQNTNVLLGGGVWASIGMQNADNAEPNLNGYYELLLPSNDYQVGTWGYSDFGYINQTRPGPVTVVSSDIGDVNFYLARSAYISGQVWGDGAPLQDAGVSVGIISSNEWGGWNWADVGYTRTDSNGNYTVFVPPDVGYAVCAEGPDGGAWLRQFYSNATTESEATLVTPFSDVPATNINFNLPMGAIISGRVLWGELPVTNIDVQAGLVSTNEWGHWQWEHVNSAQTDTNGDYSIVVPPDIAYCVGSALDQSAEPIWMDQYYSNSMDIAEATLVTPITNSPTTDINFALIPAMGIEGWVLDATNHPLRDAEGHVVNANVQIGTCDEEGNWGMRWETWSDADGHYFGKREAGSNHIVRVSNGDYHEVYFRDKLSATNADIVSAGRGQTVSNVNFVLYDATADSDEDSIPDYIEGYVMGTNPFNSNDVLRCTDLQFSNTCVSVSWAAVSNKAYTLQRTSDLLDPSAWTNLTPEPVTAVATNATFMDSNAPAGGSYRLLMTY